MKIKAIGKLCEQRLCVCMQRTADLRENWIGNGNAMYLVPQMYIEDVGDLLTIWDVKHEKQSKYLLRNAALDEIISFDDETEEDIPAADGGICVAYHGRKLAPFYAAGTMILIDTDYLAPIKDDQPDYFVRPSLSGQLHLVAKNGLLIEAVIAPVGINAELYGRLKTMLAGMETAAGMDEEECGVWSLECGVKVSPEATD